MPYVEKWIKTQSKQECTAKPKGILIPSIYVNLVCLSNLSKLISQPSQADAGIAWRQKSFFFKVLKTPFKLTKSLNLIKTTCIEFIFTSVYLFLNEPNILFTLR